MDSSYEAYYRRAFEEVPPLWPERQVPAFVIRDLVQDAAEVAGPPVRADAKLFLYLNMLQMIVQPIVVVEEELNEIDLIGAVRQDLVTIVSEAENVARKQGEEEISGHAVVNALSATWPELRLTQPWRWE